MTPNPSLMSTAYRRIAASVPHLTNEVATEILSVHFGINASVLRALPGETDCNLFVQDADGAEFVLKISAGSESNAVKMQQALVQAVVQQAPDIPIPRTVPTQTGDLFAVLVRDGKPLLARVLTWCPGTPLSDVTERSDELLADVGRQSGRLAAATGSFLSNGAPAAHYWDLRAAAEVVEAGLETIDDSDLKSLILTALSSARYVLEDFDRLPQAVVHHDLNSFNILVGRNRNEHRVSGIIDFGDAIETARVCDLAVLLASVTRGRADPLTVAATVTRAYVESVRLTSSEADAIFPLVLLRTAVVLVTTARLTAEGKPGDVRHRSTALQDQMRDLVSLDSGYVHAVLREACGHTPLPGSLQALTWLETAKFVPIVSSPTAALDLTAASPLFDDADPSVPSSLVQAARSAIDGFRPAAAVRPYGEPHFLQPSPRSVGNGEQVNASLGVVIYSDAGTPVRAPLAGIVTASEGTLEVLLSHNPEPGICFWTRLQGVLSCVSPGESIPAGAILGETAQSDGVLGPSVTAQLLTVDPTGTKIPIEVRRNELALWSLFSPDASPLAGPEITRWLPSLPTALEGRRRYLPVTHPTYFKQPINMVRARDCYFYDEQSRSYLDALNNVTLLGHCHPRLTAAATRQLKRLNTNSRFVYDVLTEYTEALTATLPPGLDVVYMLNSGSEANDLALRMARHATGRHDFVIIDDAYHGYTSLVSDVSPSRYKYYGKPEFTHPTANPDRYRGKYGYDDPEAGAHFARHTIDLFDELIDRGRAPAAFIYEPLLAGGGQIVLPPGYLAPIHAAAKERGIATISDEVQVGFGRLGEAFWGFQTQGPEVVPDFVTMGKAMGNGFPVSAMVTTREISQRFDENGRFFATYGGNPVACAVALELLKVLQEEGLQANALHVGEYFRQQLWSLADRHELIGDVRGQGFYSGIEFVLDRETKEPASEATLKICDRLKDNGVLVYPTGPWWNILKLKPPMTFTKAHADIFVDQLDRVLDRGW